MPRMYVKIKDENNKEYFFGWSTISDSVSSDVMDKETFNENVQLTDEELKRLDETGVTNPYYTLDELIECSDDFPTFEELLSYCKDYCVTK